MTEKTNDILSDCLDKPNCVSSQSQDKDHYIEPLKYVSGFDKPHEYGFQAAKKHRISRASIKNTPMLLYILPLEKGLMNIHI